MRSVVLGIVELALLALGAQGAVVYLENTRLRVGVETARGGVLTSFEDKLDAPWHFVIPVYLSMPSAPCPDPANGNSVYSPTR